MAQWVENLPAIQETGFLGQEDPLEEGMASHSSILAWTISCTEKSRGFQSIGLQKESDTTEVTEHASTEENEVQRS